MRYNIETFDGSDWVTASQHTQEVDRDMQYDRFIANGIDAATLRKSTSEE